MSTNKRNILLCLGLISFSTVFVIGEIIQSRCNNKLTCRECIQTAKCAWCMTIDFDEDRPRCYEPSHVPLGYCSQNDTYNPSNTEEIILKRELTIAHGKTGKAEGSQITGGTLEYGSSMNRSTNTHYSSEHGQSKESSSSSTESRRIVQLYPQEVKLSLRLNEVHKLQLKYSQAEEYPVDLYYLMDLSKSMEDDKDKLSKLGDLLSDTMRNITSNFRLGFGSFVDKVLMPYVSTIPKNVIEPCPGCAAPYGYRNIMPLSTDTCQFSEEVKNAAVSGNLDAPEGGFDAIMQAIVCREEIRWRTDARKLLVFSTDAGFHYAGDGKLGGVITPNDGLCHLDETGNYTHSTIIDYPSISQINQKVKENSIHIIFAVTSQQYEIYKTLAAHLEGASAAILSSDSSNVVELVEKEYNKISSSIEMKNDASNYVKINYFSSCKGGGDPIPTNKCDGLKVGDTITFTAEISVTSCPEDPAEWNQKIRIYPVGLTEHLIIDLTLLCDCNCEKEGQPGFYFNAEQCKNHGNLTCGICNCAPGFFGDKCECDVKHVSAESDWKCRAENSTIDCSGRGVCICGKCQCDVRTNPNEKYTGKYCQCDNYSCIRIDDKICSGHGTCGCYGKCLCDRGWKGHACDCEDSMEACITPNATVYENGTLQLCSGNGDCICNKCVCHMKSEGRWSGKHCERCPTCHGKCFKYKPCIECQVWKVGDLAEPEKCAANCSDVVIVAEVETLECDDSESEFYCQNYDDDVCKYEFCYKEEGNKVKVTVTKDRDCPPKIFTLGVVLGVIAAIVLVGLAILLLWKLLTTIHDRREFARFEKERMMAKWDTGENPIYKQATSTFKNPTYAGK